MNMQLTIVAVLFALVLVGAMVYAQDAEKPVADKPDADASKDALKDVDAKLLPQNNAQAGLDLYAQMAAGAKGNVFFSPYSISEALTMTYLGAAGKTKTEMAKVLCVPMGHKMQKEITPWTDVEVAAAYKDLHARMTAERGKFSLHIANALWGAKGADFREPFLKAVDEQFGGKLSQVDFSDSTAAAKTINDWVSDQTKEKIKDLVPAGALDASTRLVLTNAIYFKAPWQHQFKAERTHKASFFLDAEKKTDAKIMEQTEHFRYGEAEGVKVLEMPYEQSTIGMVVLLPDKKDGLAALEKALTTKPEEGKPSALDGYLKTLKSQRVHTMIPKFTFTSQFALGDALKAMGMKLAFDAGKADFTAMSEKEKLFISAVIHKAFVDVNEEGTEAAAATAVIMRMTAVMRPQEPKEFVADHPFVFLIRDSETGSVLFMGRIADPTK